MLELTGNVKLCYFQPLDQFLRVRTFDADEIEQLLSGMEFRDKRGYVQFVINTLLVDYHDKIVPALFAGRATPKVMLEREDELFALCVDANPSLALDHVSRYMTAHASPLVFIHGEKPKEPMPVSREKLRGLQNELSERIVGQDDAVRVVADAVRKAYVGFRDAEKPVGNFLFVGPTGVGKTELAKVLARSLFQEAGALVRIDCSEYAQAHEYAKLIGSPPGYIGHEDGGQLTEALRRRSHVVVLFDEIEKADPKVHNLLLQILDDGQLTDGKGQRVSFRNAIVILTSNVGTRELAQLSSRLGFGTGDAPTDGERRRTSGRAVESFFRPELLNRIDEVILFRGFTHEESRRIAALMLEEVRVRLARSGIEVVFEPEVEELLVRKGIDERYGARPLRRAVKRFVESPLASHVLEKDIEGGTIHASVRDEALAFA